MRRIALLVAGALLATPAAAQTRACRDVRTLVNVDGGDLHSVGWSVEAGVGVRVAVEGRRIDLPPARSCELEVDAAETGLTCIWETADSVQAGALYDRVLARITPCLDRPLEAGRPFSGAGARIVQSHSSNFVTRGRETGLGLRLFEHAATGPDAPGGARSALYVVELSVSIDMDRVIPGEEAEEEAGGGA